MDDISQMASAERKCIQLESNCVHFGAVPHPNRQGSEINAALKGMGKGVPVCPISQELMKLKGCPWKELAQWHAKVVKEEKD